jgi:hypothetical protein
MDTDADASMAMAVSSLFDEMTVINLAKFLPVDTICNVATASNAMREILDTPIAWSLRCAHYTKTPAVHNSAGISLEGWKQLARSISRYNFVGFSSPIPATQLQKIAAAAVEIEVADERMTEFCVQLGTIDRTNMTIQDLREQGESYAMIAWHTAEETIKFDGDELSVGIELQREFPEEDNDDTSDSEDDDKIPEEGRLSVMFTVCWEGIKLPPYNGFEGLEPCNNSDAYAGTWTAIEYQAHYLISSQPIPIADAPRRTSFGAFPEAGISHGTGEGYEAPNDLIAALQDTTTATPIVVFFRIHSLRSTPSIFRPIMFN